MSKPSQCGDSDESQRLMDPDHYERNAENLLDSTGEKLLQNSWTQNNSMSSSLLKNILRNPQPYVISTILFLLPSFIVEPLRNSSSPRPLAPNPIGRSAWLDGLRGIAALLVYIFHWSMQWYSDILTDVYGAPGSANKIIQLPFIRIIISGPASVALFFVISGYVITIKTLSIIYKGGPQNNERLLSTLCGAVFRRPFRLFLPAIVTTFIIATVNSQFGTFQRSLRPRPEGTSLMAHWTSQTLSMMNIFNLHKHRFGIHVPFYNPYLWTIPVELKNSILVFLLLLAFCKVKRWVHFLAVIGVGWTVLLTQGDIDAALFCAGLLIAEITLIFPPDGRRGHTNPTSTSNANFNPEDRRQSTFLSQTSGKLYWMRHLITITVALLAMHLVCYPLKEHVHAGGYKTISEWTPRPFYPEEGSVPYGQALWSVGIGAVLFITASTYSAPLYLPPNVSKWVPAGRLWLRSKRQDHSGRMTLSAASPFRDTPFLQVPFTTRFAQYLGWVSYSLYLCHGPVISVLGLGYFNDAKATFDVRVEVATQLHDSGQPVAAAQAVDVAWREYSSAFIWVSIPQVIVLFWVSDVFTRAIDTPIVKFTRWVWCAVKTD